MIVFRNHWDFSSVYSTWDSRNVDIHIKPFIVPTDLPPVIPTGEDEISTNMHEIDVISTDLGPHYPSVPVVFLDVPCHGTWRDITFLEGDPTEDLLLFTIINEFENSWTDRPASALEKAPNGFSETDEVGYFRDFEIESDREVSVQGPLAQDAGRVLIYYYGTIDIQGTVVTAVLNGQVRSEVTVVDDGTILDQTLYDEIFIPTVGTFFGDWNGDCQVTSAEILEFTTVATSGTYNPLYDNDCDGVYSNTIEGAVIATNYANQPGCVGATAAASGGGGSAAMMAGGLGGEPAAEWVRAIDFAADEADNMATWFESVLTEAEFAEFLADLSQTATERSGTPLGFEMSAVLAELEE